MGNTIISTKPMIGARSFAVASTETVGGSPTGQMRVRRNVNSLTQSQFDILARAFKRLNNANSTWYLDFVRTHASLISLVHGNPRFLPWHRAFLLRFEDMLTQEMDDPTFGIPYWDWCEDVTRKRTAPMWGPTRFGGWGNPVADGPFSGAQWPTVHIDPPPGVRQPDFRGRNLVRADAANDWPFTSRERVLTNLRRATFQTFAEDLEDNIHGTMHVWVGGGQGQMGFVPVSVNDPVFWLHHCNVDRVWAQWQSLFPEAATAYGDMTEDTLLPQTLDREGQPRGQVTVKSVLDAPNNRYVYEGQGGHYQTDVVWGPDGNFQSDAANFASSGAPALAVHGQKLHCARQESRNEGWVRGSTLQGTTWDGSDGHLVGSSPFGISGSPALAVYRNTLHLVNEGRGNDGWVWHATRSGTTWSGHAQLLDAENKTIGTTGAPALAVYGGKLHCIRQGRGNEGWLWHSALSDGTWSKDELLRDANGNTVGVSGSPALAVYNGELHCVHQGRGNDGRLWWTRFNGTVWSADKLVPKDDTPYSISGSPALVVFAGKLLCLHEIQVVRYKSDESTIYITDNGTIGIGGSAPDGAYNAADGYLSLASFDGTGWSHSGRVSSGSNNQFGTSGAGLAVHGGKLFCIREDRGNAGRMRMCTAAFGTPTPERGTMPTGNVTKPMINPNVGSAGGKTGMVST
jgi:hypothetical protein